MIQLGKDHGFQFDGVGAGKKELNRTGGDDKAWGDDDPCINDHLPFYVKYFGKRPAEAGGYHANYR